MTSDEFKATFWPGQQLTSEGIRTTIAQEMRKGRIVLVHELATAPEMDQRRAEELVTRLNPANARLVIGTFDVDGGTVVVTKFLPGFTTLLAWLESAAADDPSDVAGPPQPAADGPPSETFTKLFGHPVATSPEPREPPAAGEPPAAKEQSDAAETPIADEPLVSEFPAPATAQGPPSESFTMLFGGVALPPPVPPPVPPDPPSESFTRLFGEAVAAPNDKPPPPESPGGEFGRNEPAQPEQAPGPGAEPGRAGPEESSPTDDILALFGGEPTSSPPDLGERPPAPPGNAVTPPPTPRTPARPYTPNSVNRGSDPPAFDAHPKPGPPRIRTDVFDEGIRTDPRSGSRGPATPVPAPFGASPPLTPEPPGPFDVRSPARPVVRSALPVEGGYTEVLTPARPPINAPVPRPAATTAPPPAAAPRPSYLPLIIGLSVIGLIALALVMFFVLSGD